MIRKLIFSSLLFSFCLSRFKDPHPAPHTHFESRCYVPVLWIFFNVTDYVNYYTSKHDVIVYRILSICSIRTVFISISILVTISPRHVFSQRQCTLICGYFFRGGGFTTFTLRYDFSWCLFVRHLAFLLVYSYWFCIGYSLFCIDVWWFCKRISWFCLRWSVSYFSMIFKY